ncbi:MAG: SpoIIE family protein phosphatase [Crocinitomicaceae bacterium]
MGRYRCFFVFLFLLLLKTSPAQDAVQDKIQYYLDQFSEYEYEDVLKAKSYLDSAENLMDKTVDQELHGKFNLYKGWYYQDISEFDKSRHFFYRSLDNYLEAGNYNDVADVYGNLGNAYLDINDLKTSLGYQLKSLQINESILLLSENEVQRDKAERGRAYAWSNIAGIYRTLGEYEKALEYEQLGFAYEKEKGDPVGMGISCIGLGSIFRHMDNLDSALHYTAQARQLFTEHNYSNGLTHSNINMFNLYQEKGELRMEYLRDAYKSALKAEDKFAQASVLSVMLESDYTFSEDSLLSIIHEMKQLVNDYGFETSFVAFRKREAAYFANNKSYKKAYETILEYIDHYEEKRASEKDVDFESAELRYKFQQKSLQDSLGFQKTLNLQKIDKEKRIQRQRLVIVLSSGGLVVFAVFAIFFYRAFRVKKKTNTKLSEKNRMIEEQKELVETKNKEITDSITYAKRLQNAILPAEHLIDQAFASSFIFYRPKDVVSGDFYWYEENEEFHYLAVADCTGHGVPGAMVSVVCSNSLNRSVNEFKLKQPSDILNKTRELVVDTFTKSGENVKDGMDIALCAFDKKANRLFFAGANNPFWIIRDKKYLQQTKHEECFSLPAVDQFLIEIKGDKQPIGLYTDMHEFVQHQVDVYQGDIVYLFTDGYADQFGGDKGKKLKYKPLKELILQKSKMPLKIQSTELETFFFEWMADFDQVDDVCVIGVKL